MSQRIKEMDFISIALWIFRALIIILVIYGTINKLFFGAGTQYTTSDWIDFLGSGLSQGSLYALIALGYTMVYGILFMINFAHGEFFMAGGMTSTVFLASALAASGFMNDQPVLYMILVMILLHGDFDGHCRADRAYRLPSAAARAASRAADHGHWRFFLLAIFLPRPFRVSHHSVSCAGGV